MKEISARTRRYIRFRRVSGFLKAKPDQSESNPVRSEPIFFYLFSLFPSGFSTAKQESVHVVPGHFNIIPQYFSQALTSLHRESSQDSSITTISEAHIMASSQLFIEIIFSSFFCFKFENFRIPE